MPFMIPNFSGVAPLSSSVADMLPNLMAGYKLGRVPQQTGLEEEKMKLANLLQSEEIRKSGILNQFLPQKEALRVQGLGLNNQYKSIINQFLPGREAATVSGLQLDNTKKGLENYFYPEESSSESALRRAQAEVAGLSPDQIAAAQVFGKGSPEWFDILAGELGATGQAPFGTQNSPYINQQPQQTPFNPESLMRQQQPQSQAQQQARNRLPQGRIALYNYPKEERIKLIDRMREDSEKVSSYKDMAKSAFRAIDIVRANPDLSNDFFVTWANSKNSNDMTKWLSKKVGNKKRIEEYEKLNKLLNEIVRGNSKNSNESLTDYKAKLVEDALGKASMQGGSIEYVLKSNLENAYPYLMGYGDLVSQGVDNKFAVEAHEINSYKLKPGQSMNDMITVINNKTGQPERIERFELFRNQVERG